MTNPSANRIELAAVTDALETAHQFDASLTEPERLQMAAQAERINALVAGGDEVALTGLSLGSPAAKALRYAAETDAALTGEAYAGLSPDALRTLATRIEGST